MQQIAYEWVRSGRRSIAIQIKDDGRVVVRTPYEASRAQVEQVLEEKRRWILKNRQEILEKKEQKQVITDDMRREGVEQALKIFPERVEHYARLMGVSYGRITIREQKTRWGSCGSNGNLNFNWKLVLMPAEILDYVVVHELAHRKQMNHSKAFWRIVEQVMPDYQERRVQLKEYNSRL